MTIIIAKKVFFWVVCARFIEFPIAYYGTYDASFGKKCVYDASLRTASKTQFLYRKVRGAGADPYIRRSGTEATGGDWSCIFKPTLNNYKKSLGSNKWCGDDPNIHIIPAHTFFERKYDGKHRGKRAARCNKKKGCIELSKKVRSNQPKVRVTKQASQKKHPCTRIQARKGEHK